MKKLLLILLCLPMIGCNPFDNSDELIKEGIKNQNNNNFKIAISKYKEALEYEQGYLIYYRIGKCYYNLSNYQDAITNFSQSLSKVDNSFTIYKNQYGETMGDEFFENDILLFRARSFMHIKDYRLSNMDCNKLIKEYYKYANNSNIFEKQVSVARADIIENYYVSEIQIQNWAEAYKIKSYNFLELSQISKSVENFQLSLFLSPYDPDLEELYNNHFSNQYNYNPIKLERDNSTYILKDNLIKF